MDLILNLVYHQKFLALLLTYYKRLTFWGFYTEIKFWKYVLLQITLKIHSYTMTFEVNASINRSYNQINKNNTIILLDNLPKNLHQIYLMLLTWLPIEHSGPYYTTSPYLGNFTLITYKYFLIITCFYYSNKLIKLS